MSWSKITTKTKKPIGWWYHKIMCEIGYWIEQNFASLNGMAMYYKHLNIMVGKYEINLYGEVFKSRK